MRHQVAGKHLSLTSAHRKALKRNLAASLFEHGTISTTIEKAKFVRPFAERLITLAKNGDLHARRRAISLLQNRDICKMENGEPVKETTVIQKLFSDIGPRFADRNGGYTRIIRLPWRRVGDNGKLVLLQLVGESSASISEPKPRTKPAVQPEVEKPVAQVQAEVVDETATQENPAEETKE